jgi:hypothetical protein
MLSLLNDTVETATAPNFFSEDENALLKSGFLPELMLMKKAEGETV